MIAIVALSSITSILLYVCVISVLCAIYQSRMRIKNKAKWYNDKYNTDLKQEQQLLKNIRENNKTVLDSLRASNSVPDTGKLETDDGEYHFVTAKGQCVDETLKPVKNGASCAKFRVHRIPNVTYDAVTINPATARVVADQYAPVKQVGSCGPRNCGPQLDKLGITPAEMRDRDVFRRKATTRTSVENFFLTIPGKGCVTFKGGHIWDIGTSTNQDDCAQQAAVFVEKDGQLALKDWAIFSSTSDRSSLPYVGWSLRKV